MSSANQQIVLSELQCRTVVKVQISEMSNRFDPSTIDDGDTLSAVDIESVAQLRDLKLRITAAIAIAECMDRTAFLAHLAFTPKSTVSDAARAVFAAQTHALI
jgi:hypothetical protein